MSDSKRHDSTENLETTEAVDQAQPESPQDTEGHRFMRAAPDEEDTEGHRRVHS